MKHKALLLLFVSFLVIGCQYEAPLVKEHNIPIDPAVLGLWEQVQDEREIRLYEEPMLILKYSDTEYLIHIPAGNNRMYFRGYPVRIGDLLCVQVEAIGTKGGPLKKGAKKLYHLAIYKLVNGILEIKTLNPDLVDNDLKTSETLMQAFLKYKNNNELFSESEKFIRSGR